MPDLSEVLRWLKPSPRHYLAASLATGALLAMGDRAARAIGLDDIRGEHLAVIGGAFLLSTAMVLSEAAIVVLRLAKKRFREYTWIRRSRRELHDLSKREREILREYIFGDSRTQYFKMEDGVIGGLAARNIVFPSSNVGNAFDGFAYNIQPWALKYLRENQGLLKE